MQSNEREVLLMFNEFCYRIDWIDAVSGDHCFDILTKDGAMWELQNDWLNEIYSVTYILDEDGNESENLIDSLRAMLT